MQLRFLTASALISGSPNAFTMSFRVTKTPNEHFQMCRTIFVVPSGVPSDIISPALISTSPPHCVHDALGCSLTHTAPVVSPDFCHPRDCYSNIFFNGFEPFSQILKQSFSSQRVPSSIPDCSDTMLTFGDTDSASISGSLNAASISHCFGFDFGFSECFHYVFQGLKSTSGVLQVRVSFCTIFKVLQPCEGFWILTPGHQNTKRTLPNVSHNLCCTFRRTFRHYFSSFDFNFSSALCSRRAVTSTSPPHCKYQIHAAL
eukprot:Gb_33086 [translate_table: standard]